MEWLVIGISGVTCGGKTTLAHSLLEYLQSQQNLTLWPEPYKVGIVRMVSQDNYFLPVHDERQQWLEQINAVNFELLTSLDMKKMLIDISWIMYGHFMHQDQNKQHTHCNENNKHANKTNKITYQQQQQSQKLNYQQGTNLLTDQNIQIINILIIEGFIIFNQPDLYKLCNIKYHFHLPYEKCYERRQKRSYDPPDVTGYFELCVWPHYEKSISEYRQHNDIVFLNGEIERERIFKYVFKHISTYFDESKVFSNPSTSLSTTSADASLVTTTAETPLITIKTSTSTNFKPIKQDTVLNLRMQRHLQQPIIMQQHQQLQQQQQIVQQKQLQQHHVVKQELYVTSMQQ